MNYKSEVMTTQKFNIGNLVSWGFGIVVLAIAIINMFWGNDSVFGVFLALLSFVYFLPVNDILRKMMGVSIPWMGVLKIVLGLLILWASLGVGELFNKIEMMGL
ncbi:MAG: hypothetical protein V4722_07250 [Bacteroidota bacterium]